MPASLPPAPKRILLIRLSAFGDVVIATGLLHGLKRAYPDAEIDWLVQPEFASLLRTQHAIAQVQVWPRKDWRALFRSGRWLALWQAIRTFTAALRARDYDLVIDAQGLFKSRALARLAGGQQRIGYDGNEPGRFWLHQLVQRHPEAHAQRRFIGDEHGPMLQALAVQGAVIPQLDLPVPPVEKPYLVAAPFTTRPQKHWPEAHWISLLKMLAADGQRVLILGGPADAEAAARLVTGAGSEGIENLAGQTSLLAAAQCIAGATAVVGVDTGLTHLGFALQRPTLALFGSTRPYADARITDSVVLFVDLPCAPCGRHPTCNARWDCLVQLTPQAVLMQLKLISAVRAARP
ncbi:MAG: glycosyltransferase family 9 protein [Pseudomonadota bacterium]